MEWDWNPNKNPVRLEKEVRPRFSHLIGGTEGVVFAMSCDIRSIDLYEPVDVYGRLGFTASVTEYN